MQVGEPYRDLDATTNWSTRGRWPAFWVAVEGTTPYVAAYRLELDVGREETRKVHVSADERYELFLNGMRIGRGCERGDVEHWPFDTYELALNAGENVLVARVWSLGRGAAYAQMSQGHGFLLSPDDPALAETMATGHAAWEGKTVGGYRFKGPQQAWGTGLNVEIDGAAYPWGVERGEGDGWGPVEKREEARFPSGASDQPPIRRMVAAALPPMFSEIWPKGTVRHVADHAGGSTHAIPIRKADSLPDEETGWQALLGGISLTLPARTRRRVLIDLDDYVCAYPELTVSGGRGASVRVHWQESLFESETSMAKGDRDAIEGKFFTTIWEFRDGIGDTFLPDGGQDRSFTPLWWQCGRYVEVLVETGDTPLTIHALNFCEDRYPFENEAPFESSDPQLAEIGRLGFRALQMCSHETYMDCPYYEQLQYIGDTRLQALVTYVTSPDDRLPRQALRAFDRSRQLSGLTQSRYPSNVVQIIPPFSLWWVNMVHDFALWRGDPSFVSSLIPGVRAVLDAFRSTLVDGLVTGPVGWNYVDWVPAWKGGMPLGADRGVSSLVNRQFELALRDAAALEEWLGEPEMASRDRRNADEVSARIRERFWNEPRGLFADDLDHTSFSEHAQALAILAGETRATVAEGLLDAPDLHRATIYFSHYLFEAYAKIGRTDRILGRLDLWRSLLANGLKTTIEMPEPTRSDCHAWGAHPLYHYAASLLGIRPEGLGRVRFRVEPALGGLAWAKGGVSLPSGLLRVSVEDEQTVVEVPPDIRVAFRSRELGEGRHVLQDP